MYHKIYSKSNKSITKGMEIVNDLLIERPIVVLYGLVWPFYGLLWQKIDLITLYWSFLAVINPNFLVLFKHQRQEKNKNNNKASLRTFEKCSRSKRATLSSKTRNRFSFALPPICIIHAKYVQLTTHQ